MKKRGDDAADRLISGKLRGAAARKGAAATTVTVDGVEYAWSFRHGWVVFGKGLKVISVSVSLRPERTRELVLGFTAEVDEDNVQPPEARVVAALAPAIRAAIAAGWDPESRGRAFRYQVDEPV